MKFWNSKVWTGRWRRLPRVSKWTAGSFAAGGLCSATSPPRLGFPKRRCGRSRARAISEETAEQAGEAAVANATPLKDNRYKVRLAKTAVKRAVLKAVDQLNLEGGA